MVLFLLSHFRKEEKYWTRGISMIGIIMAGGIGTRFWPLSRKERPKQYLPILSERTMIQMTADRLRPLVKEIYVVTSADQAHLVREQLPELADGQVIVEPFGRNTAPCIALSAAWLKKCGVHEEETMLVVPADHSIKKTDLFFSLVGMGVSKALEGDLVSFGIAPTYPATGYGYIEAGEDLGNGMFHVKQFKEKPDRTTAEAFLAAGTFFWNSGMFLWKLGAILDAYATLMPDITALLAAIATRWDERGLAADISDLYEQMPRVPVDIGIMERARKRTVVRADIDWSDVGGWQAIYDLATKDAAGNAGRAQIRAINACGCYVHAAKTVALLGVEDLVVVDTPDLLLIARRSESERVKEFLE